MARSYSDPSLASPPPSALNSITLNARLVTLANGCRPRLTPTLIKAVDQLTGSIEKPRTSRNMLDEVGTIDPSVALAADVRSDAACGGLYGFLQGWMRLPSLGLGAEKVEIAQRLFDRFYTQGLGFAQLSFVTQWADVQKLLERARLPENDELIE